MQKSNSSTSYIPGLDVLRALAVLMVIGHHWFDQNSLIQFFPLGPMGVTLFFVLSGFLISRILLSSHLQIMNGTLSRAEVLKTFYIRRSLRIFPVYFLVIFLCLLYNLEAIKEYYIWFLSYTSNFLIFQEENWFGTLAHTWTLAVEEQYYLVIPFVILFSRTKHLLKIIWSLIILGPLFRIGLYILYPDSENLDILLTVLPFSALECFGLGSLLAYLQVMGSEKAQKRFDFLLWNFFILALIGLAFLICYNKQVYTLLWLRPIFSVISLYLIDWCVKGNITGKWRILMYNPVLVSIGKVSYGIYLFHMFAPYLWESLAVKYSVLQGISDGVVLVIWFSMTLFAAYFSWYFLEKPLNDLKVYFAYKSGIKEKETKQIAWSKLGLSFIALSGILMLSLSFPDQNNKLPGGIDIKGKKLGFYSPDLAASFSNEGDPLAQFPGEEFQIASCYIAWGANKECDIPVESINKIHREGKSVMIIWEPWSVTFPELGIDNKDIYKSILEGRMDPFLQKQAELLKQCSGKIYMRWTNNYDRPDIPWAALTQSEIREYKAAYSYVVNFFRKQSGDSILWIWSAPNPDNIREYMPNPVDIDFIGIPALNSGVDPKEPSWQECYEIVSQYKKVLSTMPGLQKKELLITEFGMLNASENSLGWYKRGKAFLEKEDEIAAVVFFFSENSKNDLSEIFAKD